VAPDIVDSKVGRHVDLDGTGVLEVVADVVVVANLDSQDQWLAEVGQANVHLYLRIFKPGNLLQWNSML
jgi:hypothetical protein